MYGGKTGGRRGCCIIRRSYRQVCRLCARDKYSSLTTITIQALYTQCQCSTCNSLETRTLISIYTRQALSSTQVRVPIRTPLHQEKAPHINILPPTKPLAHSPHNSTPSKSSKSPHRPSSLPDTVGLSGYKAHVMPLLHSLLTRRQVHG